MSVTGRWSFKSYYRFPENQLATTLGGGVKDRFSIMLSTFDPKCFQDLGFFFVARGQFKPLVGNPATFGEVAAGLEAWLGSDWGPIQTISGKSRNFLGGA